MNTDKRTPLATNMRNELDKYNLFEQGQYYPNKTPTVVDQAQKGEFWKNNIPQGNLESKTNKIETDGKKDYQKSFNGGVMYDLCADATKLKRGYNTEDVNDIKSYLSALSTYGKDYGFVEKPWILKANKYNNKRIFIYINNNAVKWGNYSIIDGYLDMDIDFSFTEQTIIKDLIAAGYKKITTTNKAGVTGTKDLGSIETQIDKNIKIPKQQYSVKAESIDDIIHNGHTPMMIGQYGEPVKRLQEMLTKVGIVTNPDMKFGIKTEASVKSYQKSKGLTDDGYAGKKTLEPLVAETNIQNVDVATKPIQQIPTAQLNAPKINSIG